MSFPAQWQDIPGGVLSSLICLLIFVFSVQTSLSQTPAFSPSEASIPIAPEDRHEVLHDVLISFEGPMHWSTYDLPGTREEKALAVYDVLSRRSAGTQAEVRAYLDAQGIAYTAFRIVNAIHVRIPEKEISKLRQFRSVARISVNTPMTTEEVVQKGMSVDYRSVAPEWGIVRIGADSVWQMGFRGEGVVIGGTDTGYEWDHPAIKATYRGTIGDTANHHYNWHDAIHEINPLNGDTIIDPVNNPCGLDSPIPCDDSGHGTHTMGTMVGEDGENQIGVAPAAKWIACRNMERGWGSPATYLECLEWFLAPTDGNGENPDPLKAPHVINNSWSCPPIEGCNPDNFELLRQAVVNLRAAGIVVVVSAGNSGGGCSSVSTPLAFFEESFTVGAININDTIANFSSRGPVLLDGELLVKPNVCAPGVQVRSAWLNGGYRFASGTSMSGPHVAGVVALMISANPALAGQVELIESILEATARPKTTQQECGEHSGMDSLNNTFGYGIVDAVAAVEAALTITDVEDMGPASGRFRFFPNPVSHQLYISHDEVPFLATLRIFTNEGRMVHVQKDLSLPATIDFSGYPSGLYFIQPDQERPVIISVVH